MTWMQRFAESATMILRFSSTASVEALRSATVNFRINMPSLSKIYRQYEETRDHFPIVWICVVGCATDPKTNGQGSKQPCCPLIPWFTKNPARGTKRMHSEHIVTPLARTNLYKFSFLPQTVLCWNNLPQSVINVSTNREAFSSSLTSHYFTWNYQHQTTVKQVISHEVAQ